MLNVTFDRMEIVSYICKTYRIQSVNTITLEMIYITYISNLDRLCGLVVRVPGC
jgi:hypothetical protein